MNNSQNELIERLLSGKVEENIDHGLFDMVPKTPQDFLLREIFSDTSYKTEIREKHAKWINEILNADTQTYDKERLKQYIKEIGKIYTNPKNKSTHKVVDRLIAKVNEWGGNYQVSDLTGELSEKKAKKEDEEDKPTDVFHESIDKIKDLGRSPSPTSPKVSKHKEHPLERSISVGKQIEKPVDDDKPMKQMARKVIFKTGDDFRSYFTKKGHDQLIQKSLQQQLEALEALNEENEKTSPTNKEKRAYKERKAVIESELQRVRAEMAEEQVKLKIRQEKTTMKEESKANAKKKAKESKKPKTEKEELLHPSDHYDINFDADVQKMTVPELKKLRHDIGYNLDTYANGNIHERLQKIDMSGASPSEWLDDYAMPDKLANKYLEVDHEIKRRKDPDKYPNYKQYTQNYEQKMRNKISKIPKIEDQISYLENKRDKLHDKENKLEKKYPDTIKRFSKYKLYSRKASETFNVIYELQKELEERKRKQEEDMMHKEDKHSHAKREVDKMNQEDKDAYDKREYMNDKKYDPEYYHNSEGYLRPYNSTPYDQLHELEDKRKHLNEALAYNEKQMEKYKDKDGYNEFYEGRVKKLKQFKDGIDKRINELDPPTPSPTPTPPPEEEHKEDKPKDEPMKIEDLKTNTDKKQDDEIKDIKVELKDLKKSIYETQKQATQRSSSVVKSPTRKRKNSISEAPMTHARELENEQKQQRRAQLNENLMGRTITFIRDLFKAKNKDTVDAINSSPASERLQTWETLKKFNDENTKEKNKKSSHYTKSRNKIDAEISKAKAELSGVRSPEIYKLQNDIGMLDTAKIQKESGLSKIDTGESTERKKNVPTLVKGSDGNVNTRATIDKMLRELDNKVMLGLSYWNNPEIVQDTVEIRKDHRGRSITIDNLDKRRKYLILPHLSQYVQYLMYLKKKLHVLDDDEFRTEKEAMIDYLNSRYFGDGNEYGWKVQNSRGGSIKFTNIKKRRDETRVERGYVNQNAPNKDTYFSYNMGDLYHFIEEYISDNEDYKFSLSEHAKNSLEAIVNSEVERFKKSADAKGEVAHHTIAHGFDNKVIIKFIENYINQRKNPHIKSKFYLSSEGRDKIIEIIENETKKYNHGLNEYILKNKLKTSNILDRMSNMIF